MTLGAIARKMGCDVPAWDNRYLADFHALEVMRAPDLSGPIEMDEEE